MSKVNLPVQEYHDHHALVPPGKNLWENNGWFVKETDAFGACPPADGSNPLKKRHQGPDLGT